jgi:hypothetical protein
MRRLSLWPSAISRRSAIENDEVAPPNGVPHRVRGMR